MANVSDLSKNLAIRDLEVLTRLNAVGLTIVEIRISDYSPVKGKWAFEITLPPGTRLICTVSQDNHIIMDARFMRFHVGDAVYLLTDNESALRSVFTGLDYLDSNN